MEANARYDHTALQPTNDQKQMRVEVSMMGNVMQKTVVNQTKGYNEMQGQKMEMKGEESREHSQRYIHFSRTGN